jgi:hypothetical protein
MQWELIKESFFAFNFNAINNIMYALSTNKWLILLVIGAIATTVMNMMSKTEAVVREEQNIL